MVQACSSIALSVSVYVYDYSLQYRLTYFLEVQAGAESGQRSEIHWDRDSGDDNR